MKKTVRLLAWMLILSLYITSMFAFSGCAEADKKHTTVMVYMCGADLESRSREATSSMGDMIASKYNLDEVNVVILAGGSRHWSGRYDPDKLTLLTIEGRHPVVVEEREGASMGSAETLTSFLNTCHERYPAEYYDLVLWDHGGGPNSGVCFDVLYKNDSLTMQELRQALADSCFGQDPLDLLVFHACLMSSAEVAKSVAPYARYMVAGEDSIYGLSYQWLAGLENDPDSLATAKRIVDYSYAYNEKIIERQNAAEHNAFAAIDLSRMEELVDRMDAFFPKISVNLNETSFTAMSSGRREAACFGVGASGPDSDYDLVDLGGLISQYRSMAEEEADALLSVLREAVYCHAEPQSGCTGLTVYHPFTNKRAVADRLAAYGKLDFSAGYSEYIRQFASLLLDAPMTAWNDLKTGEPSADKATYSAFMLQLNEEQARYLGDAELSVLLKGGDDAYQLVCTDPSITYENGLIRGEYDGTALYAVDAAGAPLSEPLAYSVDGRGNYVIPAVLDTEGADGMTYTQQALITCRMDAASGRLQPLGVQLWADYLNGYTTASDAAFDTYETIHIPGMACRQTQNDRGELLAFGEWERVESENTWEAAIDGSWAFALLNDVLPRDQLYVTFQLRDSQNNAFSSSLYPVVGDSAQQVPIRMEYNNDSMEALRLDTDHFFARMEQEGLRISGSVVYTGGTEIIISVENLTANQAAASEEPAAVIYGVGPNWGMLEGETQPLSVFVDAEQLSQALEYQQVAFDLVVLDAMTGEKLGTVPVTVQVQTSFLFDGEAEDK